MVWGGLEVDIVKWRFKDTKIWIEMTREFT